MKSHRLNSLLRRTAATSGVPENLTREIVHLAQRQLIAAGRGHNPQHRDVVWALDRARSEWGRQFLTAIETRIDDSRSASLTNAA